MIVASETAEFGQPEITLGIIPGGGGTQRLARVIGKQRAMELVLTGRRFDAEEARGSGIVNKVVEAATSGSTRRWSSRHVIARRPPIAARLAKQAVLAAEETGADRRPRARAPPVRARDGDRGPRRGHAGVPREAQARVPAASEGRAPRGRRRRDDGRRDRPARRLGGYETRLHDPDPEALERWRGAPARGAGKGADRGPLEPEATRPHRRARPRRRSRTSPAATW